MTPEEIEFIINAKIIANKEYIDKILSEGSKRAREIATVKMAKLKKELGYS